MQVIFFYNRQSDLIIFFLQAMTFLKYILPILVRLFGNHLQITRDCGYESDDKNF